MRDMVLFCDGWEFSLQPIGEEYREDFDWREVDLPHDWLIEDTKELYKTSTGWYRHKFTLPDDGRRTAFRFEGVYMDCHVYVNGSLAGEWKYGYTTFELDVTDFVQVGENVITVRVDHREPNSRWYSGAGIYRRVWLKHFSQTHLLPDGIYINADMDGRVTVTVETERPAGEKLQGLKLKTAILTLEGEEAAIPSERQGMGTAPERKSSTTVPEGEGAAAALEQKGMMTVLEAESDVCGADRSALAPELTRDGWRYGVNRQELRIRNPKLWDIENPGLYECRVQLWQNDELLDESTVEFGFRRMEFTTDHGFFLNGRHVKLHGACQHHDLGALGSAVNVHAIKRQLLILREMGVNAIRTSHNPPAVELLELADRLGFLILDEAFDMWERPKTEYDYARFFPDWVRRDVQAWIRRDRNHPCIIGWSIGNEIYDTHADDRGQEVTSLLASLVRLHDPGKNAYITHGSNYMGSENARKCADILKIAGYNYGERFYDEQHAEHPDWCIYGSETSSVVQSRGIYHFPLEKAILSEDDEQCSALGNSSPAWAAKRTEDCIIPDRDREFCAGQFIWTGFDYIGEPTPYSTKNSYFGQVDTAGFPKDSFYIFKAAWTDYRKDPFVHIYPYWDFAEGECIDVRVAGNCPRIELCLNGRPVASKACDPLQDEELTLNVKIPYEKGQLQAIGYDETGKVIAKDEVSSFGDAVKLLLHADKTRLQAGSDDLCFIEISAVDEMGTEVANANNRIFVEVLGAGRLVGLDNGDSTDYEQYKGTSRRLFSGKLLAIVAPTKEAGAIEIIVRSPALPEARLELCAEAGEPMQGISFCSHNRERASDCPDPLNDIPVRRIALSGERLRFDPEHRELRFQTGLYPKNCSYADEMEYRITTVDGIVSPLARIVSKDSGGVTVGCLGDGEFYLRALCKNGTDKVKVFSMLRLSADGLGPALKDPYEFVSGGLYTLSGGNVSTGIQHGAGLGNGGGWVGFEHVDFGRVGSDIISVSLFANYDSPVPISIWDGTPQEGELLGNFVYDLKPIWLTYQAKAFRLPKPLRGVHTISIQSDFSYDVGGFSFEKIAKEKAVLMACYAERIYGDSFTLGETEVTGIGNNVTIDLGDFCFEELPTGVVITGRSKLAVNSIHLQCDGKESRKFLLEFGGSEQYVAREFPIGPLENQCRISLIFLPGCDFDLKSIQFV